MTPDAFIAKWRNGGDERRDAQPFFEDLCRLVHHPTPREADPEHAWFTYEYGASKTTGGEGWADVWKRGFFGWEAKGTHKSLERAYAQLKMYADALQNPPLLVVSDLQTIEVHTNFTNCVKQVHRITVDSLSAPASRNLLHAVFHSPEDLRPGVTRVEITEEAADRFTQLATRLHARGHAPAEVAHFLHRLVFCMFAEDIRLLPDGLFTLLVEQSIASPPLFLKRVRELFAAMHHGGDVAFHNIAWFNGGLFDSDHALPLDTDDLKLLLAACKMNWSNVEPAVFGTLFERGLDPAKRSQLGAHYTDPATIDKLVRPVVSEPWERAWASERAEISALLERAARASAKGSSTKLTTAAKGRLNAFLERLRGFTVLDPAAGSGNFLYLSLRALKDIEKRVLLDAEAMGLGRQFPVVGPRNVKGIEINTYAAELARVTIWIGQIQWQEANGFGASRNPILQPLDQIENRDALLDASGAPAAWPEASVIVGNPPFIGDKKLRKELGDAYVERLWAAYAGRVPAAANFVCYWFTRAREAIASGAIERAGLVSTSTIRNGASNQVLQEITATGRIYCAWSNQRWVNEGAQVRVSLISFDGGATPIDSPMLDGTAVGYIAPSLSAPTERSTDVRSAAPLAGNRGACFVGTQQNGKAFTIPGAQAREWLALPANPNGRANSDVIRPLLKGDNVTGRPHDRWVVDFGTTMSEAEAAYYEAPFQHLLHNVRESRLEGRRSSRARYWWRLGEPMPALRAAIAPLQRYIATQRVSKHRLWVWAPSTSLPDCRLCIVARDDDTTFGILHSRFHELWALAQATPHGVGDDPTYTRERCFETFPFPKGMGPTDPPSHSEAALAIAEAASALAVARDAWLFPPEWTTRHPAPIQGLPDTILPLPAHAKALKARTLTALYNVRPTWLRSLHDTLDAAVAAAYGWTWPLDDNDALQRLLKLNHSRAEHPT